MLLTAFLTLAGLVPTPAAWSSSPSQLPSGVYTSVSSASPTLFSELTASQVGFTEFASADVVRVTLSTNLGTISIPDSVTVSSVPGQPLTRSGTLIDFLATPTNANLALQGARFQAPTTGIATVAFEIQEGGAATYEVATDEPHLYKVFTASEAGYPSGIKWSEAKAWAETQSVAARD